MVEYNRKNDGSYERVPDKKESQDDRFWATAEDPTTPLFSVVKSLRNKQNWRRRADDLALHLYSDMRYVGYRSSATSSSLEDVIGSRLGQNVIRSITRALNSKLARRRSRPYVVTNDGKYQQRRAAENLEKWLLGKLRELEADIKLFPLFRLHALTFGTGCIRVASDPARGVYAEVIPTNEIVVDDSEARYGTPQNLYFIRVASKARLLHDFRKDKKAVEIIKQMKTGSAMDAEWGGGIGDWDKENTSDVGVIVEAYHLPSGPDAGDGRHVVAVSSGTIVDEPWERDHFPCAWMRGELRPAGMWGIGVPEDLASLQIEINETAMTRRDILEMLSRPYWLVERGMKVMRASVSNLIGRVVEWTSTGSGLKPEVVSPNAVPAEMWQHDENLKRTAFENKGVSQLAAQMLKPAGLNSGKALRAFNEMESELLSDLMNEYEAALLKVCELLIEEQKELGEESSKHSVTYVGRGSIEKINWKDIDKNLEEYVLEILPASAMSSTLSGKIEDVYDMRDLGLLTDPGEIEDYLDMPDRRRVKRKHMSDRQLLDKVIDLRIIERGESVQPKPTWNLRMAQKMALVAINDLELYEDAPLDRLELLRTFIVKCQQLEKLNNPAANQVVPPEQQVNVLGSDPSLGIDPALAAAGDPALAGDPGALDAELLGGAPADLGGAGPLPVGPGGPIV